MSENLTDIEIKLTTKTNFFFISVIHTLKYFIPTNPKEFLK